MVKVLLPVSFKNPRNIGIGHQFKTFLTSKAKSTQLLTISEFKYFSIVDIIKRSKLGF